MELRGGDPTRVEAAGAELAGAIGTGDVPARQATGPRAYRLLSRAAEEFPAPQARRSAPAEDAAENLGIDDRRRAHAAWISAQAVMTARPRRWPLMLMQKPSQAGVESACT
jgi:hypothetical protein